MTQEEHQAALQQSQQSQQVQSSCGMLGNRSYSQSHYQLQQWLSTNFLLTEEEENIILGIIQNAIRRGGTI
jgi:hypothetical protein